MAFLWVSEPGEEPADARLRWRATWAFAANTALWLGGGFAVLAAGAGQTVLPGGSAEDTLALLVPWLRPERAYPLLRGLTGWLTAPWEANLLGAALIAGAAALLFRCVTSVFFALNVGSAGPRPALRWAFAAGNVVAALFLLRGEALSAGAFFLRESWDVLLLLAAVSALIRGAIAGKGWRGALWGMAFGGLLGAMCAESPMLSVAAMPLAVLKSVADRQRTGECFRALPPFCLAFAMGAGGVFLLSCGGWPETFGAAGVALWTSAAESLGALRGWLPARWLMVGALHLAAPALMAVVGTMMLCDRRGGKMVVVAAALGVCLVGEALWAPAMLWAQAPAGRPAPLPLGVLAAVGQGVLLCGLAAWALRPRAESLCGDGIYRLTACAGVALGGVLAAARLWGCGEEVVRRWRLDETLGRDWAAAVLDEAKGANLVEGTPWLAPCLLMEPSAPLILNPQWARTARGREILLEGLLRVPELAGSDPGRLRRMAELPWPFFIEDLLAQAPALRQTARFCGETDPLIRARLFPVVGGLTFAARTETEAPPDPHLALKRQRALWKAFGPRVAEFSGRLAPRLDRTFRSVARRHLSRMANMLGAALEDAGCLEEAFGVYRQALAFDGENVPALLNAYDLARCGKSGDSVGAEKITRSFQTFVREVSQGRRSRGTWERLLALYGPLRNDELLALLPGDPLDGRFAESLHALLSRAGPSPSVRVWLVRAEWHRRRGEWKQTEACFREVLRRDPTSLPALHGLARLLLARGKPEEALRLLEGVEGHSGAERLLVARAACLVDLGRWEAARTATEAALRAFPNDPAALTLQATADIHLGDRARVEAVTLRKLEGSAYHRAVVLGALAEAPGPKRDPALAARHLRAAWVERPTETALLARALLLAVEAGAWATAETDALFLLRRDASEPAALLTLGLIRVREGADAAAADYFGRLMAAGGDIHPIAFVAQSGCLRRLGRLPESVEMARRAVAADPQALPAAVALTMALACANREECTEALIRVRKLDPKRRVPQTVFAEGWVALYRRDAEACRAARERLAREAPIFAEDPESQRDAMALDQALSAFLP